MGRTLRLIPLRELLQPRCKRSEREKIMAGVPKAARPLVAAILDKKEQDRERARSRKPVS
jgi:hypothetical protein